jgi:hypothetical protein
MKEYFRLVNEQTKAILSNKYATNAETIEFMLTNGYLKIYDYYLTNKKIPTELSYYRGVFFNPKWSFADLIKVLDKLIKRMESIAKSQLDLDIYGIEKFSSDHYIILNILPHKIHGATHIVKKNTDIIFTSSDTILIPRGSATTFSFPKNDFTPSRFVEHYLNPDEFAPYIFGSETVLRPGEHWAQSIGPVSRLISFGTILPEIYIINVETPIKNYYQAILTKGITIDKKVTVDIVDPASLFEIKKKMMTITLIYTKILK